MPELPRRARPWHADDWLTLAGDLRSLTDAIEAPPIHGRLKRATGMLVECSGLKLPVGSVCRIVPESGGGDIDAEVVGFAHGRLMLMPSTQTTGLTPGALVEAIQPQPRAPHLRRRSHPLRRQADRGRQLPIGPGLLGRVVDSAGRPLDGFGELKMVEPHSILPRRINAMQRRPIRAPLITGIRSIDAFTTLGQGQRLGLFAGAGVGKSVLLSMLAGACEADVIVMAMVGERGREVREFVEHTLTASARQRSTIVVSPSDEPPLCKIQAANYAAAIAERHRDQGLNVLFLMDSLTRYAMAIREIALATGEPPATRGYPPSVFARLSELIERSGTGDEGQGSVTALFTVLVEGDDMNDPVGDAARSYLDGHIVLSRELAEQGHFPAVDIERSISRVMPAITQERHQRLARGARAHWATYARNRELISIGAYAPGNDPELDEAVALQPAIRDFLRQGIGETSHWPQTESRLNSLVGSGREGNP
ncbi:MAG: FliI/YscN family ATPase [Burkholderiaceae bacterium]